MRPGPDGQIGPRVRGRFGHGGNLLRGRPGQQCGAQRQEPRSAAASAIVGDHRGSSQCSSTRRVTARSECTVVRARTAGPARSSLASTRWPREQAGQRWHRSGPAAGAAAGGRRARTSQSTTAEPGRSPLRPSTSSSRQVSVACGSRSTRRPSSTPPPAQTTTGWGAAVSTAPAARTQRGCCTEGRGPERAALDQQGPGRLQAWPRPRLRAAGRTRTGPRQRSRRPNPRRRAHTPSGRRNAPDGR